MENNQNETDVGSEILLESIWSGKITKDEGHMQELRRLFLTNLAMMEDQQISIEKRVKECNSDLERIELVQECFHWLPVPPKYFKKLQKNAQLSIRFREIGNMEYKQDHLLPAIHGYNLAIMFGRCKQEETALAYANRAGLLLHMKEPQLALRDVSLAQENNFPLSLKSKLVERRKKCLLMIEDMKQKRVEDADDVSTKKFMGENYQNQFFSLKTPSTTVIGAEEFVRIDNCEHRGRRMTVDRDVEAGSVVLMEKPFVAILEKELRWDYEHCHFCLTRILGGIPCEFCTFSIYCNEKCREEGQRFHQYEHKIWAYLHGVQCSRRDLLAIRTVEILGPQEIYKLYQKIYNDGDDEPKSKAPLDNLAIIPGFNKQGIYDSSTYSPVYNLVSHKEAEELYEAISNGFKALMLTHLLKEMTSFFDILNEMNDMRRVEAEIKLFNFTASLVLHHLQSIPYNAISLSEIRRGDENTPHDSLSSLSPSAMTTRELTGSGQDQGTSIKSISYATAIFPLLAMCNHECNANAVHLRVQNGKTALVTLRNLKANEEISITYGPLFSIHNLESRQKILTEKYNFKCQCEACVHDWSAHVDSPGEMIYIRNKITNMKKFSKFESELEQVHRLILNNCHVQAMEKVRPCLTYFASNFPPWFSLNRVAQDLFKKILLNIVNN